MTIAWSGIKSLNITSWEEWYSVLMEVRTTFRLFALCQTWNPLGCYAGDRVYHSMM